MEGMAVYWTYSQSLALGLAMSVCFQVTSLLQHRTHTGWCLVKRHFLGEALFELAPIHSALHLYFLVCPSCCQAGLLVSACCMCIFYCLCCRL